jgi:hypothetical protein
LNAVRQYQQKLIHDGHDPRHESSEAQDCLRAVPEINRRSAGGHPSFYRIAVARMLREDDEVRHPSGAAEYATTAAGNPAVVLPAVAVHLSDDSQQPSCAPIHGDQTS